MISYAGKTTIEAIEYISLRVEILQDLCSTLVTMSENPNPCDTDKETLNRLSGLISILEDELNLLNEDVKRTAVTEIKMRGKRLGISIDEE